MKTKSLVFLIISVFCLALMACGGGGSDSAGSGGGNKSHISGTVTSGGVPVAGVSVSLTDRLGKVFWGPVLTDADGNFSDGGSLAVSENVSATFTAAKDGYSAYTKDATLSPGATLVVNVVLTPLSYSDNNITGIWTGTAIGGDIPSGTTITLDMTQTGSTVAGTVHMFVPLRGTMNTDITSGSFSGGTLQISFIPTGSSYPFNMTGTISDDGKDVSGSWAQSTATGPWEVRRN